MLAIVLVGCGHKEEVATSPLPEGSGKATNPSGVPQGADQQKMADQMQQAGSGIGQRMAEAARAEQEAKARTGGK